MVSFALAFGKGAVTALRQKQERKWEKEAYEDSPEFQKHLLDIESSKANLAETRLDIQKKQKDMAGGGENFDVFPLGGNYTSRVPKDFSGTMDTTPYAFNNIGKLINENSGTFDKAYRDAVLLTDPYGRPHGEIAQTTASYFETNLASLAERHKTKAGKIIIPLDKLSPLLFEDKEFLSLPWVSKAIIRNVSSSKVYKEYLESLNSDKRGANPTMQIGITDDGKNLEIDPETIVHNSGKPDKKDQDFYDNHLLWRTGKGGQIIRNDENQIAYANYVLEDEREGYNKAGFRAKHMDSDYPDFQIIDNILVDYLPAPTEYTIGVGDTKTPKKRNPSGTDTERADWATAYESSEEVLSKIDDYLNVLKDPSVIPGIVGWGEGFVTSFIGKGGVLPNVGTLLTKYAGLRREITETDEVYKYHRDAQKMIKTLEEGASKGVLSKRATMEAIRIDLAYTIALANNGGDARSLSDKDFAYALEQVGDFNATLATKSGINEKLVRLAAREEGRKYPYYIKASEHFGKIGTHDLYMTFANKVGRERGNLLRAHYYAAGHEGVLKPDTYTIDQVEKYDPRRDMPSTNSIFKLQRDLQ